MRERVDWFSPRMGEGEKQAVADVIDSAYLNEGEVASEFENQVAKKIGTTYAVATTNGTSAIFLALAGLGIGSGDEVLVPNLTFVATANAVRLTGAKVKLVDIEAAHLGICPLALEASVGPNTKAVVAVDVNGRGVNYSEIQKICDNYGLVLVIDSAEAFGSSCEGKMSGSAGAAGCFSFSAAKTISTGQGGMITTNDENLHGRLRELKDQGRRQRGTGGNDLHPVMGYNFKYTNLQAAVGLVQLSRLEARLKGFLERDNLYKERLTGVSGISFPENRPDGEYRQWFDILLERRDVVVHNLEKELIGNRPFWLPLSSQQPYSAEKELYPVTEKISAKGLWLPSYFDISEEVIDRVCDVVKSALSSHSK